MREYLSTEGTLDNFVMRFSAAIEHGTTGMWYGRFIDLPGTHARATNRQRLLEELEEELCYHLRWLERHGEDGPVFKDFQIVVEEEVGNIRELGESGGEVAFFRFDRRVVTDKVMKRFIRYMGHNRRDLIGLYRGIPQELMTYTPPGKKRNIIDILKHVCNAEEFYISRFGEGALQIYEKNAELLKAEIGKKSVSDRLEVVRRACVRTLEEVVPDKGDTVFAWDRYTKYPQEKWTAYKVMRRFLEHEREHYYNIRQYLGLPIRG